MSEELLPLTDEQLAQYEAVINKIRESKKYKEYLQTRVEFRKEVEAANAEGRFIKIPKKLAKKEKKLIQSMYADFEKEAPNIPGATVKRKPSKKNFFQRMFSKKEKDFYVPGFIESAFWKELEKPGTFKEEYNMWVNNYNSQQNSSKSKEETKVETKQPENTQENTKQTTSNDTHSYEQKSAEVSSSQTTTIYSSPLIGQYIDLAYNSETPVSVGELWEKAKEVHKHSNEEDANAWLCAEASELAHRDPKFHPIEMLLKINEGVQIGFEIGRDDKKNAIIQHRYAAEAVGMIAENNKSNEDVTRMSLRVLNNMTKECMNFEKGYAKGELIKEDRLENISFASTIIGAYSKVGYDNPNQAKIALDNIANITKNLAAYERNPHDIINTVDSIVNNSEPDKDVATSAFSALNLVSPQNSEEASKMLSLYRTLSLENPDLAEASVMKIRKIFDNFPHDEKLQKECLSTLESLNGFRSTFDDETKQKLDIHSKYMKSKIDNETIKRAKGIETTWKEPTTSNSQRSSTNTQTSSNFGNTYGSR